MMMVPSTHADPGKLNSADCSKSGVSLKQGPRMVVRMASMVRVCKLSRPKYEVSTYAPPAPLIKFACP